MRNYNGTILPDLPTIDRKLYPYAVIVLIDATYYLQTSSTPMVYDQSKNAYECKTDINTGSMEYCTYHYDKSSKTWILGNEASSVISTTIPVWTDHNILNYDTGRVVVKTSLLKYTYGNKVFPVIPTEYATEYPYVYMVGMTVPVAPENKTKYQLIFSAHEWCYQQNDLCGAIGSSNTSNTEEFSMLYEYNDELDTWVYLYDEIVSSAIKTIGAALFDIYVHTVEWVNTDLKTVTDAPSDGIVESDVVYVAATEPVVVEEPKYKYYYNAILLPELPMDETYPYKTLIKYNDTYMLGYSKSAFIYTENVDSSSNTTGVCFKTSDSSIPVAYSYNSTTDSWRCSGSAGASIFDPKTHMPVWTNHDIKDYVKTEDGSENYLSATNPVLYEKLYKIRESRLKEFADEARRFTNNAKTLNPTETLETLKGVSSTKLKSTRGAKF